MNLFKNITFLVIFIWLFILILSSKAQIKELVSEEVFSRKQLLVLLKCNTKGSLILLKDNIFQTLLLFLGQIITVFRCFSCSFLLANEN